MKKITIKLNLILCLGVLLLASCSSDPIVDKAEENLYNEKGAIATIANVVGGFFDLTDINNTSIGFDLGEAGEPVTSIDIFKSFNGGDKVMHSSSSPGNITISLADAVDGLGVAVPDVVVGDVFVFSFVTNTSSGTYQSGRTLSVTASCPSSLGGTFPYVSTDLAADNGYPCPTGEVSGEVTFTDLGGGVYEVSDLGFGQYGSSCWGDQPATSPDATFTDVCNSITSGGLDQYGLAYIWVITDISGSSMSISWSNNYADSGKTVITRTDGTDWPALTTN